MLCWGCALLVLFCPLAAKNGSVQLCGYKYTQLLKHTHTQYINTTTFISCPPHITLVINRLMCTSGDVCGDNLACFLALSRDNGKSLEPV